MCRLSASTYRAVYKGAEVGAGEGGGGGAESFLIKRASVLLFLSSGHPSLSLPAVLGVQSRGLASQYQIPRS